MAYIGHYTTRCVIGIVNGWLLYTSFDIRQNREFVICDDQWIQCMATPQDDLRVDNVQSEVGLSIIHCSRGHGLRSTRVHCLCSDNRDLYSSLDSISRPASASAVVEINVPARCPFAATRCSSPCLPAYACHLCQALRLNQLDEPCLRWGCSRPATTPAPGPQYFAIYYAIGRRSVRHILLVKTH